jgi:hypothetical protein
MAVSDAAQAANAGMDRLLQGLPNQDRLIRLPVQIGGAAGSVIASSRFCHAMLC